MPITFDNKVTGDQLAAAEVNELKTVINENEDAMERQHVWQDLSSTTWNALASSRKIRKTLTENTAITITNIFPEWDGLLRVVGNGHTLTINGIAVDINSTGVTLVAAFPSGDEGALEIFSNAATTTTGTSPTQLSAPTLTAGTPTDTTIPLTWTNVSNESSYKIEKTIDNVTWTQIGGIIPANTTSYTATSLTPETLYSFRIKAVGDGTTYTDSTYGTANATTAAASTGGSTGDLTFTDKQNQTNTAQIFSSTDDTSFSKAVDTVLSLAPDENGRFIVDLTTNGDTKWGFKTTMVKDGGSNSYIVGILSDGTNFFPTESGTIASFSTPKGSATKVAIHADTRATTPVFTMEYFTGGAWVVAFTYSYTGNVQLFEAYEIGANTSGHIDYPKLIKG
jgi:hypothetical protein